MKDNTARKGNVPPDKLKTVTKVLGKEESGAFNDLIHERTRLAIISALAVKPSLSFSELRSLLDLSAGNLSIHSQKLEAAGYITCEKTFSGRTPMSVYKISKEGLRALHSYLNHMETLIKAVNKKK